MITAYPPLSDTLDTRNQLPSSRKIKTNDSTFVIDTFINSCYLPASVVPAGWFDVEPDYTSSTYLCTGQIGPNFLIPPGDTSICAYLSLLDEQYRSGIEQERSLMHLISMFRRGGSESEGTDTLPPCFEVYPDTTTICNLKKLIIMDSLWVTITTLDTMTTTITSNFDSLVISLRQGNNQIGRESSRELDLDSLYQTQVITITTIQQTLDRIKTLRRELWTQMDTITIEECTDSIIRIEMLALQFLDPDRVFSVEQEDEIIDYARLCSDQYGKGVHMMRAIASRFYDEDFRVHDLDCEEAVEERSRPSTNDELLVDFQIVPNPNSGKFRIIYNSEKEISKIEIIDLTGRILSVNEDGYTELNINHSCTAFVSVVYSDGTRISKPVIITR